MCSEETKQLLKEKGKALKDFVTVLVFSIIGQVYDSGKDWYVVIILFMAQNYAWGSLFAFPILYGYVGQFAIWYQEEVREKNSPRKTFIWKFFPVYGILRSIVLFPKIFNVLFGRSTKSYIDEKRRIDARINPIELFNESLPQLILLNCAVSGLILNSDIERGQREEALKKGYLRGESFVQVITKSFTNYIVNTYNTTILEKEIRLKDLPTIYNQSEIASLVDQVDVFSWMYHISFIVAYISLFLFMFDGPVPLISLGQKRLKSLIRDKGHIIGAMFCVWEVIVRIITVTYFMFGPIRQIAVFNLILGIFWVDDEGDVIDSRSIFWVKLVLYIFLIVLPPVAVQYCFLNVRTRACGNCCESVWAKIPFIYGIPVFTGVFTSLKSLKNYRIKSNEEGKEITGIVLQVSQKARMIYQLIRIIIMMAILIVIWSSPNLKILRSDYFIYMHIVNALDIASLLWASCWQIVHYRIRRVHIRRWGENVARKYGIFHPDLDRTYRIEKKIGTTLSCEPPNTITLKNIRVRTRQWIWNKRNARITKLPDFLEKHILFRLPYEHIQKGTVFSIKTLEPSDIYIAHEEGERSGWSENSLQENGWKQCVAIVEVTFRNNTPNAILLKLWHKKTEKNQDTKLPDVTTEKTVAAIFVVEGGDETSLTAPLLSDDHLNNSDVIEEISIETNKNNTDLALQKEMALVPTTMDDDDDLVN